MFGYIAINKPELKVREYERYHAYYCGLCQALKNRCRRIGQLTLSFDMTFLGILLTSLYEPHTKSRKERCILHPVMKHVTARNECIDYAADMNIMLAYYDLLDDWQDDRNALSLAHAELLKPAVKKIRNLYPRQAAAIETYVRELGKCEKEAAKSTGSYQAGSGKQPSDKAHASDSGQAGSGYASDAAQAGGIDLAAGLTGTMLGSLFVWKEDEWQNLLHNVGFFMGKFVYLMDAYDDLASDEKKGLYNPWISMSHEPDFEQKAETILNMMMTECSIAFEKLPLIRDRELLRNVIYAGVWTKYTEKKAKQSSEEAPN